MSEVEKGPTEQQRILENSNGKQEGENSRVQAGVAEAAEPPATVMTPAIEEEPKIGVHHHNGASPPRGHDEPQEVSRRQREQPQDVNDGGNAIQTDPQVQRDRSPPKKRFRHGGVPEVIRASASALPPPPIRHETSEVSVLTESSAESPAEARLGENDHHPHQSELNGQEQTPLLSNRQQRHPLPAHYPDISTTAETPHPQSPSSTTSQTGLLSYTSPSSHVSESSPLPPPPAPPSTPASLPPSFQEVATPRPGLEQDNDNNSYGLTPRHAHLQHGVMENASDLERKQKASEAATPAPKKKAGPSLVEDFSEWAVGDRYELMRILGRGSYGEVAQARDLHGKKEDAFVAIKRITSAFEQEVDAVRLYREMHILRRLRGHECIIQLLDVVQPPTDDLDDFHDLYLVFEYVDTDLYKLIMSPQYLTTEHIQTFLYQMLAGLKYIHSSSVIHRDLKPANILLNEDCSLKICDFGLARIVNPSTTTSSGDEETKEASKETAPIDTPISFGSPPKSRLTRQLTKHVVTRWYRAPELILIQPYTSAVDIWSLGCILAELLSMQEGSVAGYEDRQPLFPGGSCYPLSGEGGAVKKDERLDQLSVIFGVIGTPDPHDMSSIGKASEYIKSLGNIKGKPFESLFPAADPVALDLLKRMLKFNAHERCTAEEALEHEFLKGVRRKEMEKSADQPLVGPEFVEAAKIDLKTLKRRTYEEVLCYRDQAASLQEKPNGGSAREKKTGE